MDILEQVALEEEIERLRHQVLVQEMRIVVLETDLEQAEVASTKAMMLLMGLVNPLQTEIDLTPPVDVH